MATFACWNVAPNFIRWSESVSMTRCPPSFERRCPHAASDCVRFRVRCVPDADGNSRCLSACSEHPLIDSEELQVAEYKVGDKQVLILSSTK